MKKLFLTLGIALCAFTVSFAQDSDILQEDGTDITNESGEVEENLEGALAEKEVISAEQLPTPVSSALTSGAFESMEIREAYRVSPVSAQEGSTDMNYEVHMEDGNGQTTVLIVNAQGEIMATEQPASEETPY